MPKTLIGAGMLILAVLIPAFLPADGNTLLDKKPDGGKGMINPYLDYKPFPKNAGPEEYLGRKVTITGRISDEIWQHMFRGPGDKPYIQECYIDPDEDYEKVSQLVGYNIGTFPFDWDLYKPEHLRFYGSFGIVTGSSKRPGKVDETYREVYFDLVDIEMLPQ